MRPIKWARKQDRLVNVGSLEERARRRITRRLVPYLFVLYVVAFLDRVNISYAALAMTDDLGFTPEVYGFGVGIFFIGYFLLDIPGALLVENWSARGWIARIMVSWGVLAALTGFIQTATQFYWIRFLLGLAEAGFFPGVIVYLSHWFRSEDRARAVALFMAAVPISNIIGSPISGFLLGREWFDLAGWRWLLILEGLPATVLGVITLFYLTDRPHQANWLTHEERLWIIAELERERRVKRSGDAVSIWRALTRPDVICLVLVDFFVATGIYGLTFWLPTILKGLSGLPNLWVTLIAAVPHCIGLLSMVLIGKSSDRTGERRWHAAVPAAIGGAGLLLSGFFQENVTLAFLMFCGAAAGLYGFLPSFWTLTTSYLAGSPGAAAVGLIAAIGNLSGFAGPYVVGYVSTRTNSFFGGIVYLSLSAVIGASILLALPKNNVVANQARNQCF